MEVSGRLRSTLFCRYWYSLARISGIYNEGESCRTFKLSFSGMPPKRDSEKDDSRKRKRTTRQSNQSGRNVRRRTGQNPERFSTEEAERRLPSINTGAQGPHFHPFPHATPLTRDPRSLRETAPACDRCYASHRAVMNLR